MARSALAGTFREFTLTYEVEVDGDTTDRYGEPVPNTEDRELVVTFEPYRTPQVQLREGADAQVVRGRGTCIDPVLMPTAIGPGTELPLTWDGRPGTLRILQVNLDALEVLDATLGQEFIAEWRAS